MHLPRYTKTMNIPSSRGGLPGIMLHAVSFVIAYSLALFLVMGSLSASAQTPDCSFARNLTVGSRGADVNCLQEYLSRKVFYQGIPPITLAPSPVVLLQTGSMRTESLRPQATLDHFLYHATGRTLAKGRKYPRTPQI